MSETILTVDLGGTKVLIGEVDRAGTITRPHKYPSDVSSQRAATEQIKRAIAAYLEACDDVTRIRGIAIDVVGRVNTRTGVWAEIDPADPQPVPLAAEVQVQFHLPCAITNDLTAATVAENLLGVGNVTKNFVYLSIGTGIAGRVVLNGQIVTGEDYDAGEVGHMVVDQNSSVRCVCGRYGCVEPLASGLGMSERAHELAAQYPTSSVTVAPGQRVGARALFDGFEVNDPLAVAVVTPALKAVANLVMNLVRTLNPKAVRFGGGVLTGGWFLAHLQPYLDPTTMRFVTEGVANTALDPNDIALQGCGLFGFAQLDQTAPAPTTQD